MIPLTQVTSYLLWLRPTKVKFSIKDSPGSLKMETSIKFKISNFSPKRLIPASMNLTLRKSLQRQTGVVLKSLSKQKEQV